MTTVTAAPTTTTMPVTSTTEPLTTTTLAPIPTFSWNLENITNQIVIGLQYNLTLYGQTNIKNHGVTINQATQYIQFGTHAHSCLLNPAQCSDNGLTFQFTFVYNKLEENTYLLTSGGELPDGVGIAIVYRFGQLQVVMSTLQYSWFTSISKNEIPKNTSTTIAISWQLNLGLEVFVNNIFVAGNAHPTPHQPAVSNTTVVYFGKQPTTSTKVEFILQTINIWYAHINVLVDRGYCKPPVRPGIVISDC